MEAVNFRLNIICETRSVTLGEFLPCGPPDSSLEAVELLPVSISGAKQYACQFNLTLGPTTPICRPSQSLNAAVALTEFLRGKFNGPIQPRQP
jgi:hypothetical protein